MIPKIIHYCWFGEKEKPHLLQECIDTWHKLLPDFQIVEWNNTNYIPNSFYAQKAFEEQKWAFLSDVVRLEKLYETGGVYLDTDMFLINNFNNINLNAENILCVEDDKTVSCGFIAAIKNSDFIFQCLSYYQNLEKNNIIDFKPIPIIFTEIANKYFKIKHPIIEEKEIDNTLILPKEYFYPFPYAHRHNKSNFLKYAKECTIAIHLWDHSWKEKDEFDFLKNQQYKKAFAIIFAKLFSFKKKHYIGYYNSIKDFVINRFNFLLNR